MSNVYQLRPDTLPNDDTEKCLRILQREARRGRVRGIAFVCYTDDMGFVANSAGEAYQDPNNTIGMLFSLARKLALRVDGGHL